jgi:hypothetical protein
MTDAARPWTAEEDQRLLVGWDSGETIGALALQHERRREGILARLRSIGGPDVFTRWKPSRNVPPPEGQRAAPASALATSPRQASLRQPQEEPRRAGSIASTGKANPLAQRPAKTATSKKAKTPEDAARVAASMAALDARWEAKKARTRLERAALDRQLAAKRRSPEADRLQRERSADARRRAEDEMARRAADQEAERAWRERARRAAPQLPASPPSPPAADPPAYEQPCPHGVSRVNCAYCTRRFPPSVRFRRY